ncbi:ScbR family autoregulator-binding transcription factor [Streptomyces sp. NPDC051563]|uniref:ScbR family autoregulator-binding transcription factor n=1 Tax=Streptomyces sp. NPDC051563 TaxID=3365659 RepID=UPI003788FB4D
MAKQERAVRTRGSLIRAAAEIFDREGFAVASLAMISTQAGVSSGALHFHFASKAALADAVEGAALERLRNIAGANTRESAGRLQCLVDVTHGLARGLRGDVVLRAGFGLCSDPARATPGDLREHWRGWVQETLAEAEKAGELRPGVGPEGAVIAVVAATVGFEALGSRDETWLAPRTVARFWELLLPTLAVADRLETLDSEGPVDA